MFFANDLSKPEGPVLLSDGSWLIVEMGEDRGCITHISRDGKSRRIIANTGCPNGLALDRSMNIWVAESNPRNPALLRVTMDGEVETFLTSCGAKSFLFPNDLAFGQNGSLYMTDSGILREKIEPGGKLREDYLTLEPDGRIFRIDIHTKQIEELDIKLRFANGIAFDPNNNLYVSETFTGWVYRYRRQGDRKFAPREKFSNVIDTEGQKGFVGPDGMAFDQNGNLYVAVAGQQNVTILNPEGSLDRRMRTEGRFPTNVAFGPSGSSTLYVTECEKGSMESYNVGKDGLFLND